jgi:hypothetical protein
LRKTTRHVRLSVRPYETSRLPLDGFSLNFVFEGISKICLLSSSFIKMWQEYLHEDQLFLFFITSRSGLLRMRNVSDKI